LGVGVLQHARRCPDLVLKEASPPSSFDSPLVGEADCVISGTRIHGSALVLTTSASHVARTIGRRASGAVARCSPLWRPRSLRPRPRSLSAARLCCSCKQGDAQGIRNDAFAELRREARSARVRRVASRVDARSEHVLALLSAPTRLWMLACTRARGAAGGYGRSSSAETRSELLAVVFWQGGARRRRSPNSLDDCVRTRTT